MGSCEAALATGAAKPRGGRPRVLGKAALEGIIYILKSGVPWRMLPKEFGCSGVTCWRCLRGWQEAGVWRRVRRLLLNKLGRLGLWIGLKCRWTRQAYRPKKVREDRSQSGRLRQTGLQMPPARRQGKHTACCAAHQSRST